jgi:hypothetical protein
VSSAADSDCVGISVREQRIQGGVMSRFYATHGIGDGDPFRVIVTGLKEP